MLKMNYVRQGKNLDMHTDASFFSKHKHSVIRVSCEFQKHNKVNG